MDSLGAFSSVKDFMGFFSKIQSLFNDGSGNSSKINKTGIVKSDFPHLDNGYIKGWVVDTPTSDIVIVCKHSNPYKGAKIFVKTAEGKKIERFLDTVLIEAYPIENKEGDLKDYYAGGDIAVCRVNEAFPSSIKKYKIANTIKDNQKVYCYRQATGKFSKTPVKIKPFTAWLMASIKPFISEGGDSGLPWFVWEDNEWKVCSHFTRGGFGEGPNYTSGFIKKQLMDNIKKAVL